MAYICEACEEGYGIETKWPTCIADCEICLKQGCFLAWAPDNRAVLWRQRLPL